MSTLADELLQDFEDSGSEGEDQQNGGLFTNNDESKSVLNSHATSISGTIGSMELDGDEEDVDEDEEMVGAQISELDVEDEEEAKAKVEKMQLEEISGDVDRVRDVYERAIAQIPPTQEKRHWRRYIYLWIDYALWEELKPEDVERARQVYQECLKLIPHKKFTFAKIWLLKAQFEIRHNNLQEARKTLGRAIGMCPKDKLFKGYIELELKLFEFVRCRTLYEKYIQWHASNCQAWIKFAELERGLDDMERTRAIYELAISQQVLDMPELLWKSYIDFEEEEQEYERARGLYERLLEKTDHVKVWISYAHFEINVPDDDEEEVEEEEDKPVSEQAKLRARKIFERALKSMKDKELKEERVTLLNAWLSFEKTHGSEDDIDKVQKQMPRKTKRRRKLDDDSYEEYIDYMFPADDRQTANLSNLLARAQAWKQSGGTTANRD